MKGWYLVSIALALAAGAGTAQAFCGFYVAKADAELFNRASQVVIARDGPRTVLTMANDYRGAPAEFALVVPVPTVLQEGQIQVAERGVVERIDGYTAPRLVEYFDPDPCLRVFPMSEALVPRNAAGRERQRKEASHGSLLGVTIEAQYTVGEYDILILSARESRGLETWLVQNGYRIPAGASEVLATYLKLGMKFFVAKVNLEEQSKLGFQKLRPIQIAFESPRFLLPIRLGTVNADGPQELFVYTLTRKGRVEPVNYRTVKLPTGMELPIYVQDEFPEFYRAMFDRQVKRERMRAVFLEYAWAMNQCDPCSGAPLTIAELRDLGVFWIDAPRNAGGRTIRPRGGLEVFVTRLHLRYDGRTFPEDLMLQETADASSFQGRYVLRHPWAGEADCAAADEYRRALRKRQFREAKTLAALTGWPLHRIHDRIEFASLEGPPRKSWWERLWSN